jgi:hypothetical protein
MRLRRPGLAAVALGGLLLYSWSFTGSYIDDAFIQFAYARNLVEHGTWGLLPGHRANTATSPLNVLLTAGAAVMTGSVTSGAALLAGLELFLLLAVLRRASRTLTGGALFGSIAFAGLAANPLLVSTLGLETLLFTLAVALAALAFAERKWMALGLALAFATLARPDGIFVALACLLWMPGGFAARARVLATWLVVVVPWHAAAWVALGSAIPDTFFIKVHQNNWGPRMTFVRGPLLYGEAFPLATLGAFALALFAPFVFVERAPGVRRTAGMLLTYGALHFGGYALLGVPPYHWYYVHQVIAVALVGALGAWSFARHERTTVGRRAAVVIACALALAPLVLIAGARGFPLREVPIHTNWGTHEQYREVGRWLEQHVEAGSGIRVAAEIGTVAFYAGRHLSNEFSEGSLAAAIARRRAGDRALFRTLLQANFRWRSDPKMPRPAYALRHVPVERSGDVVGRDIVKSWHTSTAWSARFTDRMMMALIREGEIGR